MHNVSSRFLRNLAQSHHVYSYVDVKGPSNERMRLSITGGDVQVDRTADVRRRCSIELVDPTGNLTPRVAGDLLTPYGTYLYPYRGIKFDDGTTEVAPLGVFRIAASSISDSLGQLTIDIEAYDPSRTIQRDKFTEPYTVTAGTNIATAIARIVNRTFTTCKIRAQSTFRTVPTTQVIDTDGDPWKLCTELAAAAGCEVYFDVFGDLVIAPVPDVANLPSPNYEYIEGESCVLLELEKDFSDEEGYNGVVVIGEAPDTTGEDNPDASEEKPPVRALVWDNDPRSVTYHRGPYGEVPLVYNDDTVTTTGEAQMVARAKLNEVLGFVSEIGVTVLPNPAFEAGDTIRIQRAQSFVDDKFVLDKFNVPLSSSGTQSLTLRQKRRR